MIFVLDHVSIVKYNPVVRIFLNLNEIFQDHDNVLILLILLIIREQY